MSFAEHRKKVLEAMEEDSIAICYAGLAPHGNEDEYYEFQVNSQFFYLTGLEREKMILLLVKTEGKLQEHLFIENFDPFIVRWTGKMPTREEAAAVSGMEVGQVHYLEDFGGLMVRIMTRCIIRRAYFDTWRMSTADLPDYNLAKALEFAKNYPAVTIADLHLLVCPIRRTKDAEEAEKVRRACRITENGLKEVMKALKPGMMEYQVQAIFEGSCRYQGAKKMAFPTIAGSGPNGCMMHYGDNDCEIRDGSLILLDLGAKYENYCSDITRTYPANGKFTPRQRQYYDLVLKANQAVAEAARPGITLKDLQDLTCRILAEGLMTLGKIKEPSEVSKYYMHSVSHSLGIDAHDINMGAAVLEPGWIISDEPGLYIDEEEIGIRIEDDLLITEDGCEVLSAGIIRSAEEIEEFMAGKA